MQSEWICKRTADALAVCAPRLQALPRLEFDHILTMRDRPQLRDTPHVYDVRLMDMQKAAASARPTPANLPPNLHQKNFLFLFSHAVTSKQVISSALYSQPPSPAPTIKKPWCRLNIMIPVK